MLKHIESGIGGKSLNSDYLSIVTKLASNCGLQGSVFTKDDGSIKVVAEGEEENLVQFSKKLRKANVFSSVENFYVNWS